jgi:hypothetical protein
MIVPMRPFLACPHLSRRALQAFNLEPDTGAEPAAQAGLWMKRDPNPNVKDK